MKYSIHDFQGLFVETKEIDKANKSLNPDAFYYIYTQLNAIYIYKPQPDDTHLPDDNNH